MDFLKLASERYSVRKFTKEPVKQEDLDKILEAAHVAPTGCNNQPQRILVLNSEVSVEKLKGCTKCHFDAPTAILICYNKDESWVRPYDGALSAPVDAAIVTTHMMLMAHSLGVGSCWVMHFDPAVMRKTYNIPQNYEPAALLVMGYPHPEAMPKEKHSTFRQMEELVAYDTF